MTIYDDNISGYIQNVDSFWPKLEELSQTHHLFLENWMSWIIDYQKKPLPAESDQIPLIVFLVEKSAGNLLKEIVNIVCYPEYWETCNTDEKNNYLKKIKFIFALMFSEIERLTNENNQVELLKIKDPCIEMLKFYALKDPVDEQNINSIFEKIKGELNGEGSFLIEAAYEEIFALSQANIINNYIAQIKPLNKATLKGWL
jgi:hypothetical protein